MKNRVNEHPGVKTCYSPAGDHPLKIFCTGKKMRVCRGVI